MRHVLQAVNPALHLRYVGRESSAAPACGYMSTHLEEQKQFIDEALNTDS